MTDVNFLQNVLGAGSRIEKTGFEINSNAQDCSRNYAALPMPSKILMKKVHEVYTAKYGSRVLDFSVSGWDVIKSLVATGANSTVLSLYISSRELNVIPKFEGIDADSDAVVTEILWPGQLKDPQFIIKINQLTNNKNKDYLLSIVALLKTGEVIDNLPVVIKNVEAVFNIEKTLWAKKNRLIKIKAPLEGEDEFNAKLSAVYATLSPKEQQAVVSVKVSNNGGSNFVIECRGNQYEHRSKKVASMAVRILAAGKKI